MTQGHIASIKEIECIIAMFDQDGDLEFNLVSLIMGLDLVQDLMGRLGTSRAVFVRRDTWMEEEG